MLNMKAASFIVILLSAFLTVCYFNDWSVFRVLIFLFFGALFTFGAYLLYKNSYTDDE